jgi:hypothetical protein
MKKLLYTLLIAAMAFGLSATSFAAAGDIAPPPFTDIAGHAAEGELTLMAALGIFTGPEGLGHDVKPDDPIKRAEFCKVIVLALGKGTTAAGLAGLRPAFVDEIPTWAWGYVNVASYMGIINGYTDGTFKALNPVSYAEAVTMLIRAIPGHAAQVPPGVWPYNYLFYGVDAGFTGSVDVGFAALPCPRGDMARLLFATMQLDQLRADGSAKPETAILAGRIFEGSVGGYGEGEIFIDTFGWFDLGDPVYLVGGDSYEDVYGLPVLAVAENEEIVFVQKTEGNALAGIFDSFWEDETTGVLYVVLEDGTKIPFGGPFPLVLNQDDTWAWDLLPGDEVAFNVYDDGYIASGYALRWDLVNWSWGADEDGPWSVYGWDYVASVTKSTTETDTTVHFDGQYAYWDWDWWNFYSLNDISISVPTTAKVTINGTLAGPDDLAADDVVKVATYGARGIDGDDPDPEDIIAVAATRNTVDGVVTDWRVVFPGPHFYGTVEIGETSKEYEYNLDGYFFGPPGENQRHNYALDETGQLFFDISFSDANPLVYVTGARTEEASGTHYYLIVDQRGTETTYEYEVGDSGFGGTLEDWIGHFAYLTIDGATGYMVGIDDRCPLYSGYEVRAASASNVTIEFGTSGTFYFNEDPPLVVYEIVNGVPVYVGAAGLGVGDDVWIYEQSSDNTLILGDPDAWWGSHIRHAG